jgi:hypothetical protein
MDASSTRPEVVTQLRATERPKVRVGTNVLITLPGETTTTGVVARVGTVANSASG